MKYLIVGLGNVGNEYAHTRHNIGFDVVNAFVQKHGGSFRTDRLAFVSEIKWKGKQHICICPTTYMNLSGKAVKYWMEKENIPVEQILVIVDDLALPSINCDCVLQVVTQGTMDFDRCKTLSAPHNMHGFVLGSAAISPKGCRPILF